MSKKIMEYLSKINTKIYFFTITYKYAEEYKEYTYLYFVYCIIAFLFKVIHLDHSSCIFVYTCRNILVNK